jgi:hypothetical protein
MSVIYKILFEVKLLHEFYLTQPDGQTVFDLVAQTDRINFLFNRFKRGGRDINSELRFELPDNVRKTFADYHLKLLPSYAGCKVAVEVQKQTLPDGTVVYQSKIPLPDALNISFLIIRKDSAWDAYTNAKLQRVTNAVYYFSNENVSGAKPYPFLSNAISPFDATLSYEQGEPALFGPNDIREFYIDKDGNGQWLNITGTGFVNENDRILLPLRFSYAFNIADNITSAEVVLKDKDGNAVVLSRDEYGTEKKTIAFESAVPLRKIVLDFSRGDVATLPAFSADESIFYTLEVTDNNGNTKASRVLFFDDVVGLRESWGLINIKPKVTDPAFNLSDNNGFLITRILPNSSIVPAPVFEIRMKSRLSFWRYINDEKKKLKNEHPDFLFPQNNNLVSLLPRPLSFTPFLLKKPDNTQYYLPNPLPFEMIKTENGKQYTDIFVAESALFPLLP